MRRFSIKNIQKDYKNYRPAVMWFWNDDIKKEEIVYQLKEFKDKGIRDFYIHPLFGMKQDYLSDEFFHLIKYTVEKAKELNLSYWIYDENNWPSGTAGGKLIKEHPEYKSTILRKKTGKLKKGEIYTLEYEKGKYKSLQYACINFRDVTKNVEIAEDKNRIIITYKAHLDCIINLFIIEYNLSQSTPAAIWSPFSEKETVLGYLDTGFKEAVKEFISYTHERYKAAIGHEFGKTVKGVFTDEVTMCLPMIGIDVYDLLPWSKNAADKFNSMHGYNINEAIPHIFTDENTNEVKKFRRDYWLTLSHLFSDNYMRLTSEWCRENSLQYTGHFGGEEVLFWHLVEMGDIYNSLSYFTMPGLDSILSTKYIDNYNFNIAAKVVSSAAYFQGKSRVMCETYTGSGLDCSLQQMKRIANRLLLLGVNYIQYMGAYYSLNNARKQMPMGYPPSHSYNNPLFNHYPILNDYIARLSCLNANTNPSASVMVLLPAATSQTLLGGSKMWNFTTDYPLMNVDLTLGGVINSLLYLNIPYVVAFEQLIDKGDYKAVILPDICSVTPGVLRALRGMINKDVKVVFVNSIPSYCTDGSNIDTQAEFGLNQAEDKTTEGKNNVIFMKCRDYDLKHTNDDGSPVDGYDPLYTFGGSFTDMLGSCLEDINLSSFSLQTTGRIMSTLRQSGEDEYLFVINDSDCEGSIKIKSDKSYSIYNPDNKQLFSFSGEISLTLQGYESRVITTETVACRDEDNLILVREIKLNGEYTFTSKSPNVYLPEQYLKDPATGEYLKTDHYSTLGKINHGEKYSCVFEANLDVLPAQIKLLTENDDSIKWTVNRNVLKDYVNTRYHSSDNRLYDITEFLVTGKNLITADGILPVYEAPHILPYAALLGNFLVIENRISHKNIKGQPVSFEKLGYPNYSGVGVYKTCFTLESFRKVMLYLSTDDVAKVNVNGFEVKTCCWAPYEFDITDFTVTGQNKLEIEITSVMGNMLGVKKQSGLIDAPIIKVY